MKYISENGSDTATGTYKNPWKTVKKVELFDYVNLDEDEYHGRLLTDEKSIG